MWWRLERSQENNEHFAFYCCRDLRTPTTANHHQTCRWMKSGKLCVGKRNDRLCSSWKKQRCELVVLFAWSPYTVERVTKKKNVNAVFEMLESWIQHEILQYDLVLRFSWVLHDSPGYCICLLHKTLLLNWVYMLQYCSLYVNCWCYCLFMVPRCVCVCVCEGWTFSTCHINESMKLYEKNNVEL